MPSRATTTGSIQPSATFDQAENSAGTNPLAFQVPEAISSNEPMPWDSAKTFPAGEVVSYRSGRPSAWPISWQTTPTQEKT